MNKSIVFIPFLFITACQTTESNNLSNTKSGINNPIIRGLIKSESNWNPRAVSKASARGLTQVMPQTARGICGLSPNELFNPHKSIECGEKYMLRVIARAGNNCAAYSLYNKGEYAKPSCNRYARNLANNIAKETREPFSTVPAPQKAFVVSTFKMAQINRKTINSKDDGIATIEITN